jgi:hypothetical protein
MTIPRPERGLVISYSYLWREEAEAGHLEGRKDRPCAIVLASEIDDGEVIVTVAPITHALPLRAEFAVEIPAQIKRRIGLDLERSWVVADEVNRFVWPGFDLRPVAGKQGSFAYGLLPPKFFNRVIATLTHALRVKGVSITRR